MSAIPAKVTCVCGESARRVYSAPYVGRGSSAAMRLIDSTTATSDQPAVVSSLPSSGRRTAATKVSSHPAHRSLPRP
ncbi:MAG: zinc ribbon domain-containing protein [Promicromonosporaceae bacterium]|nr:zinc ribbon domain-containing protein [Promicromonosporaceae bacterium]